MDQLYFVRAIGTEEVSEHEPMSLENAKEDLVINLAAKYPQSIVYI